MGKSMVKEERPVRLWDWFDTPELPRWFEGMQPWFRAEDRLRIEQEVMDGMTVVRAEMPGIDPDKDVDITITDGLLRIRAERKFEQKEDKEGTTRTEFRYGSFERTMRVPDGVKVEDIAASYKDGILEVRLPFKAPAEMQPHRVEVSRS